MSMAPKDGNIIKDGIAALLRGLVGSPGDTGGSTTAGTMMAKENAILQAISENMEEWKQNRYIKPKIFTATIKGSDPNSNPSSGDGYLYPSKSYFFPANIRIIGVEKYLLIQSSVSINGLEMKIGTKTFDVTDVTRYWYFTLEDDLVRLETTGNSAVSTFEEAMLPSVQLGLGIKTDIALNRELTLKMKVGQSYSYAGVGFDFYYIEE